MQEDVRGAYVLNLVVGSQSRGSGVGQALMAAAGELSAWHWGAERAYTHVESQNEARFLQQPCTAQSRRERCTWLMPQLSQNSL